MLSLLCNTAPTRSITPVHALFSFCKIRFLPPGGCGRLYRRLNSGLAMASPEAALWAWLTTHGANVSACTFPQQFTMEMEQIRGVAAAQDINAANAICTIPANLLITTTTVLHSPLGIHPLTLKCPRVRNGTYVG